MTELTPGAVVRLRCGGPLMVIGGWEDEELLAGRPAGWRCYWTVQNALRVETLPAAVLVLADPPDVPLRSAGGRVGGDPESRRPPGSHPRQ